MSSDDLLSADRALLDGYRRGDRDALSKVFRAYAPTVMRLLRHGVIVQVDGAPVRIETRLDEAETEALLHDTFVRALGPAARKGYDGVRPFSAYINTIARNVLIERARARHHEVVLLEPDELDRLSEPVPPNALEGLQSRELEQIVAGVRAALSDRDASIFVQRYEHGASLRTTADELSLPLITVRRVDGRIRAQLLTALRDRGYFLDR